MLCCSDTTCAVRCSCELCQVEVGFTLSASPIEETLCQVGVVFIPDGSRTRGSHELRLLMMGGEGLLSQFDEPDQGCGFCISN